MAKEKKHARMCTGGKPPIAQLQKAGEEWAKKNQQEEEAKKKPQESSSAASSGSTSRGPAEPMNDSDSDGLEEISKEEFEKKMAKCQP
ncbi:hypothetical protein PGT21_029778 [Puccinia graminis f. sp. tritici]|uniref:Uncharacterized protein n=1 Tax=Puccinia graminis f. sp. tritici TaxID=56615 RepID=A0A5B0Q736_PUCGR|nr:hypothetical protein PGT21_029778 [Puccinia graminis f. sp. tritici]